MRALTNRKRFGKVDNIIEEIRTRIDSGAYSGKLPGIIALAKEFGVNKNTADKAVKHLVKEGLLIRRSGYGTFIAGTFPKEIKQKARVNSRRYAFLIDVELGFSGDLYVLDGYNEVVSRIGGMTSYIKFASDSNHDEILGRLRSMHAEGVMVSAVIGNQLLAKLREEFSVVVVDYTPRGEPSHTVVWDDYYIGCKIVELLKNSGCHSITLATMKADDPEAAFQSNQARRAEGVMESAARLGLSVSKHELHWGLPELRAECALSKELQTDTNERALICFTPEMVPAILHRADCLNLVPDLKIGSVQTKQMLDTTFPGVYAVLDTRRMGQEAAAILIDIVGRATTKVRREMLVPDIVSVK